MSRLKSPAPGMWRVRGHGATAPDVLRHALRSGAELTERERKLLAALVERIGEASAATQRALGVTARRTRTDTRNEAAADMYVRLVAGKLSTATARARVQTKFGTAVRDTLDSGHALARARGRVLAQHMNRTGVAPIFDGIEDAELRRILAGTPKK